MVAQQPLPLMGCARPPHNAHMTSSDTRLSRPLVGTIAAVLIIAGTAISLIPNGGSSSQQLELFRGACFRVGLVMVALWLALPLMERNRAGGKEIGGFLLIGLLALFFLRRVPLRIIVAAAAALATLGAILRPRPKQRPGNRP